MQFSEVINKLNAPRENKDLWGIVVYEIVGDGCLNGLGTNNYNGGNFINEILRKKDGSKIIDVRKDIEGKYSTSWIEPKEPNEPCCGTLEIIPDNNDGTYKVKWMDIWGRRERENAPVEFEGIGVITGEKQLTVFYWETK